MTYYAKISANSRPDENILQHSPSLTPESELEGRIVNEVHRSRVGRIVPVIYHYEPRRMHAHGDQEIRGVLIGERRSPVMPHALQSFVQRMDAAPVAGPDLQTTLGIDKTAAVEKLLILK